MSNNNPNKQEANKKPQVSDAQCWTKPIWGWDVPQSLPRQSGKKKLYLTSDEHYHHKKILAYQNRPFSSVEEMNQSLIKNHNSIVNDCDSIIHIGDFSFGKDNDFISTALKLNGTHYFIDGSHDQSLRSFFENQEDFQTIEWKDKIKLLPKLFEFTFNGEKIVLCHYSLKKWWASHHGSFHFYGHSHGNDPHPLPNSRDIGVDTNNFFPILIEDAIKSVKEAGIVNNEVKNTPTI